MLAGQRLAGAAERVERADASLREIASHDPVVRLFDAQPDMKPPAQPVFVVLRVQNAVPFRQVRPRTVKLLHSYAGVSQVNMGIGHYFGPFASPPGGNP